VHKYAQEHLILTWFECITYEEDVTLNQRANSKEIDFADGGIDDST
jgi:hypothetical protein